MEMIGRHSKLKLFGTDGRLGRAVYFLFSFIIPIGIFWIVSAITGQLHRIKLVDQKIAYVLILVATVLALIMLIRLTIQRSHDFSKSGWLSLLVIIFPPSILLFWLVPGNKGPNRFGNPVEPMPVSMKFLSPLLFLGLLVPTVYLLQNHLDLPATIRWLQQLV